jgi:FKBP-type peptidyl-prolyl cis-trans isomerase SlyD
MSKEYSMKSAASRFAEIFGVLAVTALFAAGIPVHAAEPPAAVGDGAKVTLEYTLSLADNTPVESNVGKEPVIYTHGKKEIIPGLEKALAGMKAGDKKHVTVPADEAYGQYDEAKKVTVTKDQVPSSVKVGTRLRSQNGMEAKVVSIDGNNVVVDTNHPLAGKSLVFDVNVLKVEKQAKVEK